MIDLTLHQTKASGLLLPARITQALGLLAAQASAPKASLRGQELRVALGGSLDDGACTGFLLDFAAQGQRVRGTAHGPSAAALAWAFHALAATLKCTLHDGLANADVEAQPSAFRDAATAYLGDYENEVRASRKRGADAGDERQLLDWLAREEHIALAEGDDDLDELVAALPMDDASALYEMLLESDAVDDVFVSERELATLLARFRARTG